MMLWAPNATATPTIEVPAMNGARSILTSLKINKKAMLNTAIDTQLRSTEATAFEILSHTPVPFWYRAERADLYAERPLIELSCTGEIVAVTYNNRAIRPLRLPATASSPSSH